MQKLQLVALLAEFNAQEIAHRKHPDPLFAIDDREVAAANLFHSFEGLVGCFVATNHCAQGARHFPQLQRGRIAARHNYSIQKIALRENANQLLVLIEHTHRANPSGRHELGSLEDARRVAQRIGFAILDDISNKHPFALLQQIQLSGAVIIQRSAADCL